MTKRISLTLAVIATAVVAFASIAFAAIPVGPAGYWALNENGGATATDSSGNGNTGAISGGAVYTTSGIPATPGNISALTFDGVDDFVSVPNNATLDMTAAYSLSAWVNVTDIATYRPILFRGATDSDDIEVYVQSGSGDLIVAHNRGNGGTFDYVGFSPPPVGTLFHLVVTYDGTNVQVYYDGVAAPVVQQTTAVDAPLDTNKDWMMGKVDHSAFGGTFLFSGLLDEVVIYGRVLTAAEIAALEASGTTLTVDDDGVVGFDGSCDGTEALAYTTIQAAVNAASSGNTIKVCPGTYAETVAVDKTLTLNGAQVGNDARTRVTVPAEESIVDGPGGAFALAANGVVLAGFTVQDQINDPQGTGIKTSPLFSGYQIRNNIIKNNTSGLFLHSEGTTQTVVSQNLFDSNNNSGAASGNGIYSDQGATNILVDSNKFTGDLGTSVNFSYDSVLPTVNSNITISNNEMTAEGAIFALKVATLNITGNTISNPLNHGVQLEGNSTVAISGNSITGVSDVVNFGWSAIRLSTAQGVGANSDVTITGNTLSGGAYALGINISNGAMTGTLEVHNNAIVGHETGVNNGDSDVSEMVDATCNWWGSLTGPGPVGPGLGDTVSSNVDFTPWLTTSDLNGSCDGPLPQITVTMVKYIDGVHATAASANSAAFPMLETWDATNFDGTNVAFDLDPTGLNIANEYEARTQPAFDAGVDFTMHEVTSGPVVGASCADGKPFALVGYSSGDTLALAEAETATTTEPNFTGLTSSTTIIVWNEDCSANLTLEKTVITDDGGTAVDTDWTLSASGPTPISGTEGDASVTNATVNAGTYDLSESGGPAAYTASDWSCVENDGGGGPSPNFVQDDADTVTLAPGDDVVCTITNDDIAAKLTVTKTVVNDNGGTKVVADFPLFVDAIGVASGVENDFSAGAHTVSETSQFGYTAGAWGGDCAADGTITLALGDVKSCTIENDDQPATLKIIKHVINDDGGTAVAADFTLDSGGANDTPDDFAGAESPGTSVTLDAGSFNVTETGPSGYTQTKSSGCSGKIGNGQTKTCTITNDDILPPPPSNACATPLVAPAGYTLQNGTPGNDIVMLAPKRMFVGKGGTDTVMSSRNGNYIVCTLGGNDTIKLSGTGAVTIDAGNGKNTVSLGAMTGFVYTGLGDDTIIAGNGTRTINAGDGKNTITTGGGDQTITSGSGDDNIITGGGDDTIHAGAGKNKVFSKGGIDSLTALGGNDFFDAGAGADTCSAGGGINTVLNCTP